MVKFSKSLRECVEKQVLKNRTTIEIHGLLTEMTDNNVPSLDVYTIQYAHRLFHEPNQKFDRTSTGKACFASETFLEL